MEIESRVTGKTKIMGIIGNPIEHTVSPQLHNTISRRKGIDAIYVPFKVDKSGLRSAVEGLRALNVTGFNVTVPFKNDIIPFLDQISEEAKLMGAVNTVKNVNGMLYGYNTDGEGFLRSLKKEAGVGFKDKKVVLIGAGGAARAVGVKAALNGAKSIVIINRTVQKAEEITGVINYNISDIARCCSLDGEGAQKEFEESDIIVNTTSVGMYPDVDISPVISTAGFSDRQLVCDIIYNPPRTKFLESALQKGSKVLNGLGMLFFQGVYAYEIWMDITLSEEEVNSLYKSFAGIMKK
jgi:shikimate dehydrogenase